MSINSTKNKFADRSVTVGDEPSYVVGVGASAGGLEALERLFHGMPSDTDMAFVVVQHLSPDFDSVMDELLGRQTDVRVCIVEDGMLVEANNIYLMPPKKEMIISEGRLLLTDKDPNQGLSLPIDTFFRSLAQDQAAKAIGVILSGTGSDGSRGIRDIHDSGGLVLVQSEETAKFDGMPKSAIETGVVDLTLAPDEISDALLRFAKHPVASELTSSTDALPVDEDGMKRLMRMLRDACGIDFSLYKPATVSRRIQRRLLLNQSVDFDHYVEQVTQNPDELNSLYHDLLIGVTEFFRDPDAFSVIEHQVIPEILESVSTGEEIRIWVAGCATGEEAYSIAIALREQLVAANRPVNVKIFATDVHQKSLDFAANGVYAETAMVNVSSERRAAYFIHKGDHFQVTPDVRQMVVFAQHNIIKDAPFTRLDMISCRNLLIYLQPTAQKKAISLFHFGLKTSGILWLGPSESVIDFEDEFHTIDRHWKVYRKRRDVRLTTDLRLPLTRGSYLSTPRKVSQSSAGVIEDEVAAYSQLINQFVPPSVLVNDRREILHIFNHAGRYLKLRDGRLSNDLLDHCSPDLRTAVAGALQRATKAREPVSYVGVQLDIDDHKETIKLGVVPLDHKSAEPDHFLVTLERVELPSIDTEKDVDVVQESMELDDLPRARITSLEFELERTRENLQATIEELETSNEELHATNEELVASNEELQSTNEELHSVNEELYTVNAEYQRKIVELSELNEDMDNLLASTDVGVIFLDENLCIRKFTPHVSRLFNIVNADVGRPFDNFTHNIDYEGLVRDIQRVKESQTPIEREVKDRFGHWHLLRIRPYHSKKQSPGVVITLVDVQTLRAAQEQLGERDREQRAMLDNSPSFIFIKNLDGEYRVASGQSQKLLGIAPEQVVGKTDHDLLPQKIADRMESQDRAVATTGETSEVECQYDLSGQRRSVLSCKYALRDEAGRIVAIAGMWTDILRRTKAEERARKALKHRDRFLATLSHELRNPTAAMSNAVQVLQRSVSDESTVRRAADVLSRQLDLTKRLLDDLLDLSRITRGNVQLRNDVVNLGSVVDNAVMSTRSVITAHGLDLEIDKPMDAIPVYGDSSRLQQVVINLLVNAAKYTPAGGKVTVSLARERNRAILKVVDTGVGMSHKLQRKAFDPFVQADDTLDRSEGGMGLGLTLVKSLVEAHRGSVRVHSEGEGCGCTFVVDLPITRRKAKQENTNTVQHSKEDDTSDLKLLIVEDNDDARNMLQMLLESEGYDVGTAADGVSAVAAIETERPDLALVDIGLPGLDGYEVARRVRENVPADKVFLIALTGYGQPSDRKKALASGFDAHLTKPVVIDRLRELLGKMVETRRASATAHESTND